MNANSVPDRSGSPASGLRRTPGIRFRTAAASSVLVAVSVTGIGTVAAQAAQAAQAAPGTGPVAGQAPVEDAAASAAAVPAPRVPGSEERLAGVRRDLANAVSWGSVTADQAERFYAQISARIARGL